MKGRGVLSRRSWSEIVRQNRRVGANIATMPLSQPPRPVAAPFNIPVEYVRYAAALNPSELAAGYRDGWITIKDARELAFLRICDLATKPGTSRACMTRPLTRPSSAAAVTR